jgi:hypothetical protein
VQLSSHWVRIQGHPRKPAPTEVSDATKVLKHDPEAAINFNDRSTVIGPAQLFRGRSDIGACVGQDATIESTVSLHPN